MGQFRSTLPYLILGVVAVIVLAQVGGSLGLGFDSLIGEDLVGQLGHWLAGGATTVTVMDATARLRAQGDPGRYVTVMLFSVNPKWWGREAQFRERDAGQVLALILDAQGKAGMIAWGIEGLGAEAGEFVLILEHHDLATLRGVVRQLVTLPAAEWLQAAVVFYGKADTDQEPQAEPAAQSGTTSGSSETANVWAAVLMERRSTDWFLLGQEKQVQLLTPRRETLQAASTGVTTTVSGISGGPYDNLVVLEGLTLDELNKVRLELRQHWEQKYVIDSLTFVGTQVSVTQLLGFLR